MSVVSSYMFITFKPDIIKEIETKLSELCERKITLVEIDLSNASGRKSPQFRPIFVFAENYFQDDEFQKWIFTKGYKKEDIQIFFKGENDEYISEV